jgi:hypothetical protein
VWRPWSSRLRFLVSGVSACGFPNRRDAANTIGETIRTMPGAAAFADS